MTQTWRSGGEPGVSTHEHPKRRATVVGDAAKLQRDFVQYFVAVQLQVVLAMASVGMQRSVGGARGACAPVSSTYHATAHASTPPLSISLALTSLTQIVNRHNNDTLLAIVSTYSISIACGLT